MEININGLTEEQIKEVSKLLQSETDKLRTDYSKQIKELEQYKPKEKSQAEIELENRIKALEERERIIQEQEKQSQLQAKLKDKGLSAELAKYVRVDDDNLIDELAQVINKQMLDGSFKPTGHKGNKDAITKEQFSKMSYVELDKLQTSNPALYDKLSRE